MGGQDTPAPFPILIGDIGGTNARFSILTDAGSAPVDFDNVRTADHANIDDAIEAGIYGATKLRPRSTVLALAAPIEGDEIELTNCPWVVRPRDLHKRLGIGDVTLLNDFEAQALATVALGPEHLERIGEGGRPEPTGSRVILGPGTGLGVAGMVHARGIWIPVPGEGGHVDLGPRSERDRRIWPHLEPIEGRISAEQMLCGRGLVNIASAVAISRGENPRFLAPADVTAAGLAGSDAVAVEALEIFVTCLGRCAGDMALIFMAQGGVYLSGGIAQKIVPALQKGGFRAAFEDKAPHSALMLQMPVSVLTHPRAALFGLAAYAREPQRFGVGTEGRRWIF
ncbi:MAG: glucokinase [Rhizobiaceae bacterium]|nr:glucokinase [Rhizobiaceae bacterium]